MIFQEASALADSVSEEESAKLNLARLAGSQKVRGKELDDLDILDVNADSALGGTSQIQVRRRPIVTAFEFEQLQFKDNV